MRSWRNVDRRGHKGEEKEQKGQERSPAAPGVQRHGIVNGRAAKESDNENQDPPEVPALPEANEPKQEKNSRHEERRVAVKTGVERTKNMTAIKLSNRDKVQRG